MNTARSRIPLILILGDVVILAVVTLIGFGMHETLGSGFLRFLATFLPFLLCWLAVGASMQVFQDEKTGDYRQLWRPFWAMIAAAPLAGLLRALALDTVVIPMFIVVFGGLCALALVAWRFLYILISSSTARKSQAHG